MRRALATVALLACALTTTPASARTAAPSIPWGRLRNPILEYPDHVAKDPAIVSADGKWWALFSWVDESDHWSVGITSSRDLRLWSDTVAMPHDPSVEGEASPDVKRMPDGGFVVTYQSFVHDVNGAQAKIYYRTTDDFQTFSEQRPLARELHPGSNDRMIDAAVAWTPAGLLLGYKTGIPDTDRQVFELARSPSGSLDGPWELVGRPDIELFGDTVENYQFLHLGRRWQLLATTNAFNKPYLFGLRGDPKDPKGWLDWSKGRELKIQQEHWNTGKGPTGVTYEHANCAFVVDGRKINGRYYLVYADSSELEEFDGTGHARLGLARSRDLEKWTVPPK